MAYVIGVLNPKGGSGKTTIALHLARAFQNAGWEVLLVDSDPQGSARNWKTDYARRGGQGMFDVVALDRPTLPSELPGISRGYEIVIIDGAARLHEMTAAALRATDVVLIPIQPSAHDIGPALDLAALVAARQAATGGAPRAALVLSRVPVNTRLAREIDPALEDLGLPLFQARTTHRVSYLDSANQSTTVLDAEPGGVAAREIVALRDELIGFAGIAPPRTPG